LDDQKRGDIALEVDGLLEFLGEAHLAMRCHSDLLAKLTKTCILRRFAAMPTAAGNTPTRRVAELYEDELAFWREGERMRAEGSRAANEPGRLQQFVSCSQAHSKQWIDPIHRRTVPQL
jgi:hypothetical protein